MDFRKVQRICLTCDSRLGENWRNGIHVNIHYNHNMISMLSLTDGDCKAPRGKVIMLGYKRKMIWYNMDCWKNLWVMWHLKKAFLFLSPPTFLSPVANSKMLNVSPVQCLVLFVQQSKIYKYSGFYHVWHRKDWNSHI